jgi:hypothetical protein
LSDEMLEEQLAGERRGEQNKIYSLSDEMLEE